MYPLFVVVSQLSSVTAADCYRLRPATLWSVFENGQRQ